MRKAEVYRNKVLAGWLTEVHSGKYLFAYEEGYYNNPAQPQISFTLPKSNRIHESPYLFPFFYNLLSEGVNKKLQSRQLQIDERDSLGLLLATARFDTIGPVTLAEITPDDE